LYSCDTRLERLAQDLQDMAAGLRQFIETQNTIVRERHVAQHWHLVAADEVHIRDRVMPRPKGPHPHQRGAAAGEPGAAVEAGGLNGLLATACRMLMSLASGRPGSRRLLQRLATSLAPELAVPRRR
jgi:hypothetical protein